MCFLQLSCFYTKPIGLNLRRNDMAALTGFIFTDGSSIVPLTEKFVDINPCFSVVEAFLPFILASTVLNFVFGITLPFMFIKEVFSIYRPLPILEIKLFLLHKNFLY